MSLQIWTALLRGFDKNRKPTSPKTKRAIWVIASLLFLIVLILSTKELSAGIIFASIIGAGCLWFIIYICLFPEDNPR